MAVSMCAAVSAFDANDYDYNDYGGGGYSSPSYSYDDDGYSYYGGEDDGSDGALLLLTVGIVAVMFVFFLIKSAIDNKRKKKAIYASMPDRTSEIEALIKQSDPGFFAEEFIIDAEELFRNIKSGIAAGDISYLQSALTSEMYSALSAQINPQLSPHCDDIKIHTGYLTAFSRENGRENVSVFIDASYREYLLNRSDGRLAGVSPKDRRNCCWILAFTRSVGGNSGTCPSCGAPTVPGSAFCGNCGGAVPAVNTQEVDYDTLADLIYNSEHADDEEYHGMPGFYKMIARFENGVEDEEMARLVNYGVYFYFYISEDGIGYFNYMGEKEYLYYDDEAFYAENDTEKSEPMRYTFSDDTISLADDKGIVMSFYRLTRDEIEYYNEYGTDIYNVYEDVLDNGEDDGLFGGLHNNIEGRELSDDEKTAVGVYKLSTDGETGDLYREMFDDPEQLQSAPDEYTNSLVIKLDDDGTGTITETGTTDRISWDVYYGSVNLYAENGACILSGVLDGDRIVFGNEETDMTVVKQNESAAAGYSQTETAAQTKASETSVPETTAEETAEKPDTSDGIGITTTAAPDEGLDERGNKYVDIVFDKLPETYEEFTALPQASLSTVFDTAAMTVLALSYYPTDPELSKKMYAYVSGPRTINAAEYSFIKDRFMDYDYVPRSYFTGAVPSNDYTPSEPYTVRVSENPYSYENDGYAKMYLTSGGADTQRFVSLRQGKDGKWYLWEQFILVGIREPDSDSPWA